MWKKQTGNYAGLGGNLTFWVSLGATNIVKSRCEIAVKKMENKAQKGTSLSVSTLFARCVMRPPLNKAPHTRPASIEATLLCVIADDYYAQQGHKHSLV